MVERARNGASETYLNCFQTDDEGHQKITFTQWASISFVFKNTIAHISNRNQMYILHLQRPSFQTKDPGIKGT